MAECWAVSIPDVAVDPIEDECLLAVYCDVAAPKGGERILRFA